MFMPKLSRSFSVFSFSILILSSVENVKAEEIVYPSDAEVAVIRYVVAPLEWLSCQVRDCGLKYSISDRIYEDAYQVSQGAPVSPLLNAYLESMGVRNRESKSLSLEERLKIFVLNYQATAYVMGGDLGSNLAEQICPADPGCKSLDSETIEKRARQLNKQLKRKYDQMVRDDVVLENQLREYKVL